MPTFEDFQEANDVFVKLGMTKQPQLETLDSHVALASNFFPEVDSSDQQDTQAKRVALQTYIATGTIADVLRSDTESESSDLVIQYPKLAAAHDAPHIVNLQAILDNNSGIFTLQQLEDALPDLYSVAIPIDGGRLGIRGYNYCAFVAEDVGEIPENAQIEAKYHLTDAALRRMTNTEDAVNDSHSNLVHYGFSIPSLSALQDDTLIKFQKLVTGRLEQDANTDALAKAWNNRSGAPNLNDEWLILIHGHTASIEVAFQFLGHNTFHKLKAKYGERIIGFNHPSIIVSVQDNADTLQRQLNSLFDNANGKPVKINILAHSRGGLVARALERSISSATHSNKFVINKIILVATPNAGTPLLQPGLKNQVSTLIKLWGNLNAYVQHRRYFDALKYALHRITKGTPGTDDMIPIASKNKFLKDLNDYASTSSDNMKSRYYTIGANYRYDGESHALLREACDGRLDAIADAVSSTAFGIVGFNSVSNDLTVPTAPTTPLPLKYPVSSPQKRIAW